MAARFFVDENDLALGRALGALHLDVVYPGHPALPEVPRGSLDPEWLPVIGARRLVVVTRDQRIRYRPVEKRLWVEHGVRDVVLTGCGSQSTAVSVAILQRHWTAVEAATLDRVAGPWMYAVTESCLREIRLA